MGQFVLPEIIGQSDFPGEVSVLLQSKQHPHLVSCDKHSRPCGASLLWELMAIYIQAMLLKRLGRDLKARTVPSANCLHSEESQLGHAGNENLV